LGVIASPGYLAIQIPQNTRKIRRNIEVSQATSYNQAQEQTWQAPVSIAQDSEAVRSLARFSEQRLVDPENCENIVESQLDVWWSSPHMIAYLRSHPGPISKRISPYIDTRLAKRGT
jgi:hypothetical protein